jgi:hypothetical protein
MCVVWVLLHALQNLGVSHLGALAPMKGSPVGTRWAPERPGRFGEKANFCISCKSVRDYSISNMVTVVTDSEPPRPLCYVKHK